MLKKEQQQLAAAIIEFLQQSCADGTLDSASDDAESIGVAVQCLAQAFQLGPEESDWQKHLDSLRPATLQSIFDLYCRQRFSKENISPPPQQSTGANNKIAIAEEFKAKGNKKLVEKSYQEAIDFYSKAIDLNPNNAVYYSNRAAAYSCLNQHQLAISDCKHALTVDPDYAKAYSRLGLAHYSLGQFQEAVGAYQNALRLDPGNEAASQSLKTAQEKLRISQQQPTASQTSSPATENGEGLNAAAASKSAGAVPGAGGGLDFASLLSNPQMMSMASEFMKNPQASQMLQGLMGGAAGASNSGPAPSQPGQGGAAANPLAGLLNNPNIMQMAQQFMSDPNMRNMFSGGAGQNK